MNANETSFVADHLCDALTEKEFLRLAVVKAYGGAHILSRFIAREIQLGRRKWRVSDQQRILTAISEGHGLLKACLRRIIPPTFGWWLEVDHDVEIRARWLWLGHPGVTHSGSRSDSDVTILLALLRQVDWEAEAKEAMGSVEKAEHEILKSAQEVRRLRLTNHAHTLALPPIQSLALPAATFDEKKRERVPFLRPARRLTAEEIDERLAEAETEEEDAPGTPLESTHENTRTAVGDPEQDGPLSQTDKPAARRRGVGDMTEFFLTRDRCTDGPIASLNWERYSDLAHLLRAVNRHPAGTFTEAYLYGGMCRLRGPQKVYELLTGKTFPNSYRGRKELRPLSRREYDRIMTGTTSEPPPHRARVWRDT